MRLLFDHNLSPRLVRALADLYPEAVHVRSLGLESASDQEVWDRALSENRVIVSKDEDFHQRSLVQGHPPKVIWIRLGNCSTDAIAGLLRSRHREVIAFAGDAQTSFLALG